MSDFRRFAVYYVPDDAGLAAFGASWLGWDIVGGMSSEAHADERIAQFTETPRKYGFHATLKPPFRLAEGRNLESLATDVAKLASQSAPVRLDCLGLSEIAGFLALVPEGDTEALNRFAFRCVTELDSYREAPTEAELARRRSGGLTPRQDALLAKWGYPYVDEEFRFHLTLTGRLDAEDMAAARAEAAARLPAMSRPFVIRSIALVSENADGRFHLLHRYALTG